MKKYSGLMRSFLHDLMVIISFHFLLLSSETVDIMTKLLDFPDLCLVVFSKVKVISSKNVTNLANTKTAERLPLL